MFFKKHNKIAENNKNSNWYDGFGEDIRIEKTEYEEELVKQKTEETKNKSHEADSNKVIKSYNK